MSRPLVSVQSIDNAPAASLKMPSVLVAPIRADIVHKVHSDMAKNSRQPYAVKHMAGMNHSAESWGTGRAVARIPRVSGGGTHRAGQAAFGNMCRKGRMFAPTKIWRKWHRRINTNQKRYAVVSALAASALPSLVLARGHRVANIPEVPLVVSNNVESIKKTSKAVEVLKTLGAYADVEKVKESKKLHAGIGKLRNRRHVQRRGPLVVYANDEGLTQAFRNLPGVELCHVERLNLLQLAPGSHLGRFIIWTQGAFAKLDSIYGTFTALSEQKKGYILPRSLVAQPDLARLINSDQIQSVLNPAKAKAQKQRRKKNPLVNLGALVKLNPYAVALRRAESKVQASHAAAALKRKESGQSSGARKAKRAATKVHKVATKGKHFFDSITNESEYNFFPKAAAPVVAAAPSE